MAIGQFPRITNPRTRPGLGTSVVRRPKTALVRSAPRRLVFGAPHTTLSFAENHPPAGIPWGSANQTITPPAPVPIWDRDDFIPRTPGFEGAPFGPGLEGPAEDFEAIRQAAERVIGRPIPTEAELRARLGPSFNLSRYQESVRRVAHLGAGYPLLMPDGSSVVLPRPPTTSSPGLLDSAASVGAMLGKLAGIGALLLAAVYVLPLLRGRR